jgi:hypothetical protein
MFFLIFSICANIFCFILLSFLLFCKRHWTNNSEQVHASLELIRFLMVDILFNFTTKFFNTNPPKLWPINTIGRCHLYLHKTYSFAILNFEEISNWFLHFILVKSIFMCDWNISSSAHLWHCSKELLHILALQLRSNKICHPRCRIHKHGYHSTNFYYNFGSKKTTQPFLNRKIPLPNKNQTNGEKFKMTSSGGFVF